MEIYDESYFSGNFSGGGGSHACRFPVDHGMMYQFSAEETTEKLQRETEYIACGIETDGVRYLEKIKDAETRIT